MGEPITCFECGQPGHYARDCPERAGAGAGSDDGIGADVAATWCGGCDKRSRHVTLPSGAEARCRRCWHARMVMLGHPEASQGTRLVQDRTMDAVSKLRARWLRETDYGRLSPTAELEAEMQGVTMTTARGASDARGLWAEARPEPVRAPVEPAEPVEAEADLGHLHGEALAAAQLAEARRGRLPDLPPAPPEPSPNGHREPEGEAGEFPF